MASDVKANPCAHTIEVCVVRHRVVEAEIVDEDTDLAVVALIAAAADAGVVVFVFFCQCQAYRHGERQQDSKQLLHSFPPTDFFHALGYALGYALGVTPSCSALEEMDFR